MYKCDVARMGEKIHTFSTFGDAGHGGITRYSLSDAAKQARAYFVERMTKIGATITTDDMANMYATLPGTDPNAKRIVMASHCDSVKNGGNYDGILGVMGAMEVLETVAAENIPHKHPLTAMIWTNEEGSLYPPAMMSSGVICYDYLPANIAKGFKHENMLASKSVLDGKSTFGEALEASGYKGDKANRLNPEEYKAMFELHIEQGPILEDAGLNVGVVDCVLGMFNTRVRFYGQAAHAGTFPMHKRQDALYAAAQCLCYLHEEIDKLGRPELVYTTGEIVEAAASLVGRVDAVFTPTDNVVMAAETSIAELLNEAGIPHYTGADSFVQAGAFTTCGVNYTELGTKTADIAMDILLGGEIGDFIVMDGGIITVNTDTAHAISIDYSVFSTMVNTVNAITTVVD